MAEEENTNIFKRFGNWLQDVFGDKPEETVAPSAQELVAQEPYIPLAVGINSELDAQTIAMNYKAFAEIRGKLNGLLNSESPAKGVEIEEKFAQVQEEPYYKQKSQEATETAKAEPVVRDEPKKSQTQASETKTDESIINQAAFVDNVVGGNIRIPQVTQSANGVTQTFGPIEVGAKVNIPKRDSAKAREKSSSQDDISIGDIIQNLDLSDCQGLDSVTMNAVCGLKISGDLNVGNVTQTFKSRGGIGRK
ncbi:MAG: hypothetical protein WCJ33_08090 [Pseudomonadota bacterium]